MTESTSQDQRRTERYCPNCGDPLGLPALVRGEVTRQIGQQFGEVKDRKDVRQSLFDSLMIYSMVGGVAQIAGLFFAANTIVPESQRGYSNIAVGVYSLGIALKGISRLYLEDHSATLSLDIADRLKAYPSEKKE